MPGFKKYCSHCHKVKAFSLLDRKECDGCRSARAAYRKRYRAEILEYQRRYYASDKIRYKTVRKQWHAANRDSIAAKCRSNREHRNLLKRAWAKLNRHRMRDYEHRRRTVEQSGLNCSARISVLKKSRFCHWCCFPMKQVSIDHVTPITRGGLHVPDNLVASCRPCNSSRNNRLVTEWDWSSRQLEEAA